MSMSSLKPREMYITAAWESFCRGMWQIRHPIIPRNSSLCCHPHSFNNLLHVGRSAPGKFLSPCQQSWRVSQWLQALPGPSGPEHCTSCLVSARVPSSLTVVCIRSPFDGVMEWNAPTLDGDNAIPLSLHGAAPFQGVLWARENCSGLSRGPLWREVECKKTLTFLLPVSSWAPGSPGHYLRFRTRCMMHNPDVFSLFLPFLAAFNVGLLPISQSWDCYSTVFKMTLL